MYVLGGSVGFAHRVRYPPMEVHCPLVIERGTNGGPMPTEYDDSQWPIVVNRAWGESTDENMQQYFRMLEAMLARRERHVIIVDAREAKSLKSVHRKQLAEWTRAHQGLLRRYRAGLVLVTPSAIVRGMITATYWLSPAPFPYEAVSTMQEAWTWARRQLEERGSD